MGGMMGGNAPRQFGYMDGDRKVSALLDMINGGGMGRAGQRFEGGGLLSDIGNSMFRPYGFEERMGQVRPQARPTRPPMAAPAPAPAPAMSPFERFGGQPPAPYSPPPQLSPFEMFGGQPPAPYVQGGRTAVGPQRLPTPVSDERRVVLQMLEEMSNPSTPPARRAQIEQTLRSYTSLQGGADMLDFGGL